MRPMMIRVIEIVVLWSVLGCSGQSGPSACERQLTICRGDLAICQTMGSPIPHVNP